MTTTPPPLPRLRPSTRKGIETFWAASLGPADGVESLPLSANEVAEVVTAALRAAGEEHAVLGLEDLGTTRRAYAVTAERTALLQHVTTMVGDPQRCGRSSVDRALAAGASPARLVAASQVATFVLFCSRLVHAHRALDKALDEGTALTSAAGHGGAATSQGGPYGHPRDEFPLMDWTAWVPTADPSTTSQASDDVKGASDYYRVLSHAPELLRLRTELYDEIMTGQGALDRADRELVALSTSLRTGCSFCASVHGRRHFALTRDTVTTPLLRNEGPFALPTHRGRALSRLGDALATTPASVSTAHIADLIRAGLTEAEIMDAAAVGAMFTWANRLMLTLGTGSVIVRRVGARAG